MFGLYSLVVPVTLFVNHIVNLTYWSSWFILLRWIIQYCLLPTII